MGEKRDVFFLLLVACSLTVCFAAFFWHIPCNRHIAFMCMHLFATFHAPAVSIKSNPTINQLIQFMQQSFCIRKLDFNEIIRSENLISILYYRLLRENRTADSYTQQPSSQKLVVCFFFFFSFVSLLMVVHTLRHWSKFIICTLQK